MTITFRLGTATLTSTLLSAEIRARACSHEIRFMSGVLQGKTPKHLRKWGPPWGGSWVPWASRGDPETLSREGDETAAPVGAAATATAAAATAALAAAGTPLAIDGAPVDVERGVVEGQESGEGVNGQKAGGATLKEGRWLPTELARFVTHLEDSLHKDGRSERPGARAGAAARADACVVRRSCVGGGVVMACTCFFCGVDF